MLYNVIHLGTNDIIFLDTIFTSNILPIPVNFMTNYYAICKQVNLVFFMALRKCWWTEINLEITVKHRISHAKRMCSDDSLFLWSKEMRI